MQENLPEKIPNGTEGNTVVVYTDYASDKDGEYTYILGAKVSRGAPIPPGMVVKKVSAGKYAVFTSERGPTSKVVPETWQKIWTVPRTAPGGDRVYKSDFEVYDGRGAESEGCRRGHLCGNPVIARRRHSPVCSATKRWWPGNMEQIEGRQFVQQMLAGQRQRLTDKSRVSEKCPLPCPSNV